MDNTSRGMTQGRWAADNMARGQERTIASRQREVDDEKRKRRGGRMMRNAR